MISYTSIPDLSQLVLEESWVLGVDARPSSLTMKLDFVVTEDHPLYRAPRADEAFGTVRGFLVFEGVTDLVWKEQGTAPTIDLDNELVYGNLDIMKFEHGSFVLEGDFGAIHLAARQVKVVYDQLEPKDSVDKTSEP